MAAYFRDFLNEQLKDPDFRCEYEASELEFNIIKSLSETRHKLNITQKQLSSLTGIPQSVISKIENANFSPSIRTLKRLAEGLEMKMKLEIQPA